ncbi:MAG: dienelactone hydrolase family protein [Woeseiaceae bacterium]|nr:dienelactone hydrolase family protein [Woeseiaceae bacterium]
MAFELDGVPASGLFASAEGAERPLPGVLIAPTIRGRTAFEENKAKALAEMGYAALVIDLYGAHTRDAGIEVWREGMNRLKGDRPTLQRFLLDWHQCLRDQDEVDAGRTGAIGFCFGGLCVLDLVRTGVDIGGVASFHGLFDPPGNTSGNSSQAKVLALHGWDDPLATPEQVLALATELTELGADWQIHAYGNTLHAFTNPAAADASAGTVYNADADRRSWAAMTGFFAELFPA